MIRSKSMPAPVKAATAPSIFIAENSDPKAALTVVTAGGEVT